MGERMQACMHNKVFSLVQLFLAHTQEFEMSYKNYIKHKYTYTQY